MTEHLRLDSSRPRDAAPCVCGDPNCTRWYEDAVELLSGPSVTVNPAPLKTVETFFCRGCGRHIGGMRVHADGCRMVGREPPRELGRATPSKSSPPSLLAGPDGGDRSPES